MTTIKQRIGVRFMNSIKSIINFLIQTIKDLDSKIIKGMLIAFYIDFLIVLPLFIYAVIGMLFFGWSNV